MVQVIDSPSLRIIGVEVDAGHPAPVIETKWYPGRPFSLMKCGVFELTVTDEL
jgi:hypothetical protein